jgi:adenylate cyclase
MVRLPGIEEPQAIFEIIGPAGQIAAEKQDLRAKYELGLAAYRHGDWQAARGHFSTCLTISPEDGPARTMLQRIETLSTAPTTAGGANTVWRLTKDDLP